MRHSKRVILDGSVCAKHLPSGLSTEIDGAMYKYNYNSYILIFINRGNDRNYFILFEYVIISKFTLLKYMGLWADGPENSHSSSPSSSMY